MMKKIFAIFFITLLSIIPAFPALAADTMPRLVDGANLLSHSEEAALLGKLDEISKRQKADIVVVTVDSLEGKTPMEYADDFYDDNGYGFGEEKDGILFLVSMEERDWYISTTGYAITAFTDAGLEYMSEKFLGSLSKGEYALAFTVYAELCDDFITQARAGRPYDADYLPKEPFWLAGNLAIAIGAAFIISLIITTVMTGKLKSVRSQPMANSYVKSGSMRLTNQKDLFLYRHVDRRAIPKNNNSAGSGTYMPSSGSRTHRSSSGVRHGGRGGKF